MAMAMGGWPQSQAKPWTLDPAALALGCNPKSAPKAPSRAVLEAAPVITVERKAPLPKPQTVGSLLSTYEDESEQESEHEAFEVKTEQELKMTVASPTWSNWEDLLEPRKRHGIVMGKQPEDLIAAWPRSKSAYPPGHPPVTPPGSCTESCRCMDGTKRWDEQ